MINSRPLKRPQTEGNTAPVNSRDLIELSSDSDSPPPRKRHKSTTPLHRDGFVKTAEATTSASDNTSSGPRSQFVSVTIESGNSSLAESEEEVHHAASSENLAYQNPPSWSTTKKVGSPFVEQSIRPRPGEHSVRNHGSQSNGSTIPSRFRTSQPQDGNSPVSTKHNGSSRQTPIDTENRHSDIDDDGQVTILNSFTRPLPSFGKLTRDFSHGFGGGHVSTNPQLSPQSADLDVCTRLNRVPSSTAGQKQELSSTPPRTSMKFTLKVPLSQDHAPAHLKPEYKSKRENLLQELKKSTKPAVDRLAEVEQYFGQNGFSLRYSTDFTDGTNRTNRPENLLKAASKKFRDVDRSKIELSWDNPHPPPPLDEDVFDMSLLAHPIEQAKTVLTNRFNENRDPPITFTNDINDRRLHGKFQFIDQYIFQPGVKLSDPRPELACDCHGSCLVESCTCLVKDLDKYRRIPVQTYTRLSESGQVVLSDTYIVNEVDPTSGGFEITECNEFCGCGKDCWNRVVDRGRTLPLEIFQTARCGFGVRSSQDIIRGQFIELYLGEVITQQELERRENAKDEGASSYIFSLDFFKAPAQECYHVDGENFGTAMRFVNHSCNPNARSFTVVRNKSDKNVHYVAFFAIRDIKAGEEICIDYHNAGQVDTDNEDGKVGGGPGGEEETDNGRAGCYCGAANCRKWLWPQKVRKRKKRKTTKHE